MGVAQLLNPGAKNDLNSSHCLLPRHLWRIARQVCSCFALTTVKRQTHRQCNFLSSILQVNWTFTTALGEARTQLRNKTMISARKNRKNLKCWTLLRVKCETAVSGAVFIPRLRCEQDRARDGINFVSCYAQSLRWPTRLTEQASEGMVSASQHKHVNTTNYRDNVSLGKPQLFSQKYSLNQSECITSANIDSCAL